MDDDAPAYDTEFIVRCPSAFKRRVRVRGAERGTSLSQHVRDVLEYEMGVHLDEQREAVAMRNEIEDAVDAAGGDLDDDWWRDELYDLVRERLDERREREAADDREQEIEA